jgi:hydroxyacyl-ACP dehydratase HTD2-like protein with hotdog domain
MTEIRVEWGKVREFARATGSNNPAYLDDENAVIPTTFLCPSMLGFWSRPNERQAPADPQGAQAAMEAELKKQGIELDPRRLLHGGQHFTFHGPPVRVGERLTTSDRFDGYEVKEGRRGGSMIFVHRTTEFRDQKGDLRLESTNTAIYTSAPASQG